MPESVFISRDVALAVHEEQLDEHGGAAGILDLNALDSALARAPNIAGYEQPDVFRLAAAYASGVVRGHPFTDGNKRTGFVLCELFLELNGSQLRADDADCIAAVMDLAAGSMTEAQFADWLRVTSAR
jgi:death on curing protein